jgi:hypothetical protein
MREIEDEEGIRIKIKIKRGSSFALRAMEDGGTGGEIHTRRS